jgi:hypothetical protein
MGKTTTAAQGVLPPFIIDRTGTGTSVVAAGMQALAPHSGLDRGSPKTRSETTTMRRERTEDCGGGS